MKLIIEFSSSFHSMTPAVLSDLFLEDPSAVDSLLLFLKKCKVRGAYDISLRFTKNISDEEFTRLFKNRLNLNFRRINARLFVLSQNA